MVQDESVRESEAAGTDKRNDTRITSKYDGLLHRVILSLINVHASGTSGFKMKAITLLNSLIKIRDTIARKETIHLMRWLSNDCRVKVRFLDVVYDFYCPKGHDFNIYMNPYLHEYDVATLIYHILRRGDNFVDVGAHGGVYSLLAGKKVGPTGKIISIEPNPENIKFLDLNIRINMLRNVIVVPRAAGDAHREITLFYSLSESGFTSAFGGGDKRLRMRVTTLDDIYSRYLKPHDVDLMKIDTEGYDLNVLRGASHELSKTHYVIVEQNDDDVRHFLTRKGFKVRQLKPSQYLFGINSSLSQ